MNTELLVVPEAAVMAWVPLPPAPGRGGLGLESLEHYEAALHRCETHGPPTGILASLGPQTPGLLELVIACDAISPGLPVWALVEGENVDSLPTGSDRTIYWQTAERLSQDFFPSLSAALLAPPAPPTLRLGTNYLLLAILGQRSIRLDLETSSGEAFHLEIVGGDVWNAFSDEDQEAIDALEGMLYQPIARASVQRLQTIPGERQIAHPGLQALNPATRRLLERPPTTVKSSQDDLGTREIVLDTLRSDLEAARAAENTTAPPDPPEEPVEDVKETPPPKQEGSFAFDALLTEGIQASLARDYAEAGKAFRAALELRPNDVRARHNLDRIRRHLDDD